VVKKYQLNMPKYLEGDMNLIHIGTEKTGTTQLQSFFRINKNLLNSNFNIDFRVSDLGSGSSSDLVNIVSEQYFNDLPMAGRSARCSWGRENTLISSEHFSSRLITDQEVKNLKELLNFSGETKIIVYVKPQEELLTGMYAEAIKSGRPPASLPSFNSLLSKKRYGSSYFDYNKLLEPWFKVFSELTEFEIIPYERNTLVDGDICKDFAEKFLSGLGDVAQLNIPKSNENKTLSPEILLTLERFQEQFNLINKSLLIRILQDIDRFGAGVFFSQEELVEFRSYFEVSNSKISKIISKDHIFSSVKDVRSISKDYYMQDEVFYDICRDVEKRI